MSTPRKANIDAVIAAISASPLTILSLADATCLSIPCVQRIVRMLQDERLVYIEKWIRFECGASHKNVAAYRYGRGVDAVKVVQTPEERRAKNREYKKRQADRKAQAQESARLERIRKELERPAFRHWMDVVLFGEYQGVGA